MIKNKLEGSAKTRFFLERPHIEKEAGMDFPEAI
jgi:hypothetical protein